ncbi:O-antigen ligase family protein [Colwelliaceae bacterium 6471]
MSALTIDNITVRKDAKLAMFQLTMLMIGMSLFVDAVNGFFLSGLGIDPKLSAMFKLFLLFLVLYQIGCYSLKILAGLFTLILILLIGPVITFSSTIDLAGFFDDFTSCLKIITALIIFIYLALIAEKWPEKLKVYGKRCLNFSFLILVSNIFLGVLGYGFSSYGGGATDGDDDKSIGIKGFFYAGNELSGIYIVLFACALHLAWQKSKFLYAVIALLSMACGVLIATKAAMVASLILVFAIPLLNERNRLLNLTWLKVKTVLPLAVVGTILAFILIPIFETTGLLDRFMWFYHKKGVIGIILSGRDEFIITASELIMRFGNWTDIVFGYSKTGLGLFTKNAMEVDPIDMFLWHGIAGLILFLIYCTVFIRVSYLGCLNRQSLWAPAVLIINISLIAVSFIAGHIFTSGMLAPLFGLVNGLAYLDFIKGREQSLKPLSYQESAGR